MGPAIFHTTKGETEYSLRLLPIGGFCAMEGEDEESDDPRALEKQGYWKKLLIFVAGAAMNFLTGLLIMICLYACALGFYTAEIVELDPAFPQQGENGIMVGDVNWDINGERIYLKSDVSTVLGVVDLDENGTIEMTVKRGGEKLKRTLTLQTYTDENGAEVRRYGFTPWDRQLGTPDELTRPQAPRKVVMTLALVILCLQLIYVLLIPWLPEMEAYAAASGQM